MLQLLHTVHAYLRARLADEEGAVAAEYALLLALVALVVAAAVITLGDQIVAVFVEMTNELI